MRSVATHALVQHLADIGQGVCRITDEVIAAESDPQQRAMLTGMLYLHEELELGRRRHEEAERALQLANEQLEAQVQARTAALEKVGEELAQAQKMEAVGRLAGGIAHDFNNLLSVVLSYTALILEDLPANDPMRADVREIATAGKRCSELTRQLLAFSRKQVLQPRTLDVNDIVRGMDRLLRRTIGADITLTFLPSDRLGAVSADPSQLEQVILNLAVNARDAMPAGGVLTVETEEIVVTEKDDELEPGTWVRLAVSDTGAGMSPETISRVFEPFFTTKDVGKGTGLGLATVFGIVRQSGGHVRVESEVGQGSTFRVYLPKLASAVVSSDAPPMSTRPVLRRGTETVLVVEDQEQVRVVVRDLLRRSGYRVLEAPNGGEALLICEQHKGPIDLLVTDVILPLMNGHQLAERVRSLRPEMRVLYMSGYTGDALSQQGVLDPTIAFLQKPFTFAALTNKVREVLDGTLTRLASAS